MTTVETSSLTFSPLESLFLCQAVAQHGVANTSFERISEELRKSSTAPASNEDRLGAESLKAFFLRLLKTEAKTHLQNALLDRNEGYGQDGPTKKASTSPRLSKMEDANAHVQLLPQLVDKLYVSYKDEALREIRAEEQRYNELISRRTGTQAQEAASKQGTMSSNGGIAQQNFNILSPIQQRVFTQDASTAKRPSVDPRDGRSASRPRTSDLKIDAILNPETPMTRSPQQAPSASSAQYSTQAGAPTPQGSQSQPAFTPASAPRQSALSSHAALHQSTHEPVRPNLGGSPTFFNGQSSYNAPILPSVPGMTAATPLPLTQWSPSGSPTLNRPPQSMQSRQLPSPVDPSRRSSLPPPAPSPPISKPQPPTSLYQQSAQYAARPPPFQQQSFYQHPPGRGGVMLPPFQVQSQSQIPPIQQQPHRQMATPVPARNVAPVQQYAASEPRPLAHRVVSGLRASVGPVSQTPPARSARPQAPKSDYRYTPGSTTGWRLPSDTRLPPVILRAPSLSPERELPPAISENPKMSQAKVVASTKKTGNKNAEEAVPTAAAKPATTKKSKGARAISNTPSAAATSTLGGRTRSQSIVSQQEDPLVHHVVKTEHNTPAGEIDDNSEANETPTRPNGNRGRTRTLATVSAALAASKKRKREQESFSVERADLDMVPSSTAETDAAPLEGDVMEPHNTTVLAYRNFHKMTAPIMNNITSHKHASIFANPVKDKSTEGYSDIIRRPQDLKTIRAAIMAGSRAVAAATASSSTDSPAVSGTPNGTSTPSTSGSAGGLVELPWSVELVPPRGIVNGAQLEQEVMRMFANAVMFNPGNEGVVEDAREMFENVEVAVQAWRATQKEVSASNANASAEKTKAKKGEEDDVKNGREESVDELADTEMADIGNISGTSASRRRKPLV